jgi:hypothetical protein
MGARTGRTGLMAFVAAAIFVLGTATASAIVTQLPNGHRISYEAVPTALPAASLFSVPEYNLDYHGGLIMPSNTNYALYWDPSGAPAYPAGYEAGLDKWFEDLAHDSGGAQNTDSVLTQYYDGTEHVKYAAQFGGALIDNDPYPPNGCSAAPKCLTNAQLAEEIVKYVEANHLPQDLKHEYFLITPEGVESCYDEFNTSCSVETSAPAYCAYHGYTFGSKGPIVYSNDPYIDETGCDVGEEHPNGNASDSLLAGLSHEHSESVTDPELEAWFGPEGYEIGDKCRTFNEATEYGVPIGKAGNGSKYNQVINHDFYYYQQEWSNTPSECLQRVAAGLLPTVKHVSPKKGHAAGGALVTVTGTNLTAATVVRFGIYPAEEIEDISPTAVEAITPRQADGTVFVTVSTPAGTSEAIKKGKFTYRK